jgi:AraC-like DNA-binding protein
MLMDGMDATSAAYEVGYESENQFNREYSRFFGQLTSREQRPVDWLGALPDSKIEA